MVDQMVGVADAPLVNGTSAPTEVCEGAADNGHANAVVSLLLQR
jgi:hypothetical protein